MAALSDLKNNFVKRPKTSISKVIVVKVLKPVLL